MTDRLSTLLWKQKNTPLVKHLLQLMINAKQPALVVIQGLFVALAAFCNDMLIILMPWGGRGGEKEWRKKEPEVGQGPPQSLS